MTRLGGSLGRAALASAVGFLVVAVGCAPSTVSQPSSRFGFPAPDTGPGSPKLDRTGQRHLEEGWKALQRGDLGTAAARAGQAGPTPAARLLELQAITAEGGQTPLADLQQLVDAEPQYAAAWLTLSFAAEQENQESVAYAAAKRGAELWPVQQWVERAADLHTRWVDDRVVSAREELAAGRPNEALSLLEPALALDPESRDAVFLEVDSLVALGEFNKADDALATLPQDSEVLRHAGGVAEARGDLDAAMKIYASILDDPEALVLAAAIAEEQGAWQQAMNCYAELPEDWPDRDLRLRRAKLRWRLSVMPGYVQQAMSSDLLERGQLAVVLVAAAPELETLPGGRVPLLSDVMDVPSQREILTAVRLGLLDVDPVEHRFHPARTATVEETREAITKLAQLLGMAAPRFCAGIGTGPCTTLGKPLRGDTVAGIVLNLVEREGG